MTPFEEVMGVYKQVLMLLNHASHRCTVYEADLDGNNYLGRWVAATPEAREMILELLHTKTKAAFNGVPHGNVRSYSRDYELDVSCPVTNDESRKVRRMKDF